MVDTPDPQPPKRIFDDWTANTSPETAVFEAIGAASTCWESLREAGVFQSDRAKQIGEELLAQLGGGTDLPPGAMEISRITLIQVLTADGGDQLMVDAHGDLSLVSILGMLRFGEDTVIRQRMAEAAGQDPNGL